MKTLNKQKFQQIAFSHSSDKKYPAKPYLFLVIDATLA